MVNDDGGVGVGGRPQCVFSWLLARWMDDGRHTGEPLDGRPEARQHEGRLVLGTGVPVLAMTDEINVLYGVHLCMYFTWRLGSVGCCQYSDSVLRHHGIYTMKWWPSNTALPVSMIDQWKGPNKSHNTSVILALVEERLRSSSVYSSICTVG